MSRIIVRPATLEDLGEIGDVFVALDDHHRRQRPNEFLVLDGPARSDVMIAGLIRSASDTILVAERHPDRRILGLVHLRERVFGPTPVSPGRNVADIDGLIVAAPFRRLGIATLMLDAADLWRKARNLDALELNVRGFNDAAVAFYEASGFETLSRRMGRREG